MNLLLRIFSILALLGTASTTAFAQGISPGALHNIDSFYVESVKLYSQLPSAKKSVVFSNFQQLWQRLTPAQQKQLFETTAVMYRRGMGLFPYVENLYGSLYFGMENGTLPAAQTERFILIADTVAKMYPREVANSFFSSSRSMLEQKQLFSSKYSKIELVNPVFSFEHVADYAIMQDAPEPLPVLASVENVPDEREQWFGHLEEDTAAVDSSWEGDGGWGNETKKDDNGGWGSDSSDDGGWGSDTDDGWGSDNNDGWGDSGDNGWGSDSSSDSDGWDTDDSWSVDDGGWGEEWTEDDGDHVEVKEYAKTNFRIEEYNADEFLNEADAPYAPPLRPMPEVKGPYIKIQSADLVINTAIDNFTLEHVSGSFLPVLHTFVGQGGRATWQNVNLPADKVYAELPNYSFNVKTTSLYADYAEMHHKQMLDTVAIGYFAYSANRLNNNTERARYPRFISYRHDLNVYNLFPQVEYEGGFTLVGKKFIGASMGNGQSEVRLLKADSVQLVASSTSGFQFGDSTIFSANTAVKAYYMGSDSIMHPSTQMRYYPATRQVQLRRSKSGYKSTPFNLTFHGITLDANFLNWNIETDSAEFLILNAADKVPAIATSTDYFNKAVFDNLKGGYNFHPILLLAAYGNQTRSNIYYLKDLADARKLQHRTLQGMAAELSKQGFVDYNFATDKIHLSRKLWLYYMVSQRLNFGHNKADFDNLRITSRVPGGANATLNYSDSSLTMNGVGYFNISDSLKVQVKPLDGKVKLLENRNMKFDGQIRAGQYIFHGSDFKFDYESFQVQLTQVDSVQFLIDEEGGDGKVNNTITETSGTLQITQPNNKSGLENYPGFPRMVADGGGKVKFDRGEVLEGAYDERVTFDIPDYTMEGMNNNDGKMAEFDGTFRSGGIFPDFEEKISVQPEDKSMGFSTQTPAEGYATYNGKGNYKGSIVMNSKGLRGAGEITYLSGSFHSDDFVFYSDSAVTTGGTGGRIAAGNFNGTEYPQVDIEAYSMHWNPETDSLALTNAEGTPFNMYGNTGTFNGVLALEPTEVSGKGIFETSESINEAKNFSFNQNKYVSDSSNFQIKSGDPETPGMIGDNVRVEFDLKDKVATILNQSTADSTAATFTFPYSDYSTDITEVKWDLEAKKLYMQSTAGRPGYFKGLNSKLVDIRAGGAEYSLEDHTLNLHDVESVDIADVRIVPSGGDLTILQGGQVDSITDSKILLNKYTELHTLKKATIQITNRYSFTGSGTYNYKNNVQTVIPLVFDRFKIEGYNPGKPE